MSAPALVVLVEPVFGSEDRAWIDKIRKLHDPSQKIVAPHVTLIFPAQGFAQAKAYDHVVQIATKCVPFGIQFQGFAAETDSESEETFVYLLPKDGADDIAALRSRLVTGPLARAQKGGRPFRPHLTLGRFRQPGDAAALVRRLSGEERAMKSIAMELVAASYDGEALRNIRRVPFEGVAA